MSKQSPMAKIASMLTGGDIKDRIAKAATELAQARADYGKAAYAVENGDASAMAAKANAQHRVTAAEARRADLSAALVTAEGVDAQKAKAAAAALQDTQDKATRAALAALQKHAEALQSVIADYAAAWRGMILADEKAREAVEANPHARRDLLLGYALPDLVATELARAGVNPLPPGADLLKHAMGTARASRPLAAHFAALNQTMAKELASA